MCGWSEPDVSLQPHRPCALHRFVLGLVAIRPVNLPFRQDVTTGGDRRWFINSSAPGIRKEP